MKSRLEEKYQSQIVPALQKQFAVVNVLAVHRLLKIVVNIGISELQHQEEALKNVTEQLKLITGQRPRVTRAKRSIAGFKLRAGDPIGLMVTLRGKRMYQFLDKLVSVVLPQVKDFQGVAATGFDGGGNYTLGMEEEIGFPEIEYGTIGKVRGFEITLVTSISESGQARFLLEQLGLPFSKETKGT